MDTEYLKKISEHGLYLDKSKLPHFVQKTLNEFLKPKNQGSTNEYLALCIMSLASYVLCYQRVKVQRTANDKTFPNMYGLAFSPSGSYKDKPFDDMRRDILGFISDLTEILNENKQKMERVKLLEEAVSLYGKTKSGEPKAVCYTHVNNNKTNDLVTFFKNGTTAAGLLALREAYQVAGKGAPFLIIGELAKLLKSKNDNDILMLTLVEELFNHGYNDAVVLKGRQKSIAVKDVPQVAWFHSSFDGILEDERLRAELVEHLKVQWGRRTMFYFPVEKDATKKVSEEIDQDEITREQKMEAEADRNASKISDIFKRVFDYFHVDPETNEGDAVIKMSKEADKLYVTYRKWCEKRAINSSSEMAVEIGGRHFLAFKIAGIYAGFDNPKDGCTLENLENAIYYVEFHGSHYKRLVQKRLDSFGSKVINYLLENGWAGKVKLKEQQFCNHNDFSMIFANELPLIKEECFNRGLKLIEKPLGTSGKQYNAIPLPKDYEFIKIGLELKEPIKQLNERYGKESVDLVKQLIT